jgi:hypothetical protein
MGYIQSPYSRGFSLLLVAKGEEDLYGEWVTLHVRHTSLSRSSGSGVEPFYFKFDQLPKEVKLLNSMHIYSTQKGTFEREMLDPIIEDLFTLLLPGA